MPKFQFTVSHDKNLNELKEKVEHFAAKFQATKDWKKENECHFSGSISGISFSGIIKITDINVNVSLNLPLIAMPFKSQIKDNVIKELKG